MQHFLTKTNLQDLFYLSVGEGTCEHLWTEWGAFQKPWYVIVTFRADIRLFLRQLAARQGFLLAQGATEDARHGAVVSRKVMLKKKKQPWPKPARSEAQTPCFSIERSLQCSAASLLLSIHGTLISHAIRRRAENDSGWSSGWMYETLWKTLQPSCVARRV